MDEPASALDPIATSKIEDLIEELAQEFTVVIVTHNMQQAARISDKTAVFLTGGELVEFGNTNEIFENPDSQRVEDYITGKFGCRRSRYFRRVRCNHYRQQWKAPRSWARAARCRPKIGDFRDDEELRSLEPRSSLTRSL